MKLKQFLKSFLFTFLPHKYKRNAEKKLRQAFSLYFSVLVIGVVLSFLIFVPVLKTQSSEIVGFISNFDTLNITVNMETNTPVRLNAHPEIVIDTNATNRSGEKYLIGDGVLFYRQGLFKEGARELPTNIDLTTKTDKLEEWYVLAAILFLPAYILGVWISLLIIGLLLSLIFAYVAKLLLTKKEYTYRDCFMASLHAIMPGTFLFLVALPFMNIWWISILLFLVIYTLGLMLMKGTKFESIDLS